jgi:acetolactate synthase-1/2/3 large subunit
MSIVSETVETRVEHKVAAALKRNGVPYVFGIPGGGSSIDLIEACRGEGIPFVLVQHETSAALMAVVCGELTGSCGVSISIMATGAVNLAGGAVYAHLERHPLLCITECYGPQQAPLMSLQKVDHAQAFAAYCKDSVTLGAGEPGRQIDEAIRLALTERPGPVHIDFPLDVGSSGESYTNAGPGEPALSTIDGDLDAIADAINGAERPILIAGPVVLRQHAGKNLLRLAEKLQMAVMVTSKARGVVPEDHPLYAGVMSGVYTAGTLEERIIARSDAIVAVGLDRMELLSPWRYTQTLLALDAINVPPEEAVGRPSFTAAGPMPELLDSLTDGLRERQAWHAPEIREYWDEAMRVLGAEDTDLNAAAVLARARRAAPNDAIVTTEAGVYGRVSLYAWKVYEPGTYFDSSGANTMGFSIPAALAASLVKPNRKTICLVGDAGFLMRAAELETAARLNLAPIIIIFDDGTLGMIRIKQRSKEYARDGVDLAQTDFVRLAESFGGTGWEVRTLEQFDSAFGSALASDSLSVIDVRLDPDVYAAHIKPIRGL